MKRKIKNNQNNIFNKNINTEKLENNGKINNTKKNKN